MLYLYPRSYKGRHLSFEYVSSDLGFSTILNAQHRNPHHLTHASHSIKTNSELLNPITLKIGILRVKNSLRSYKRFSSDFSRLL